MKEKNWEKGLTIGTLAILTFFMLYSPTIFAGTNDANGVYGYTTSWWDRNIYFKPAAGNAKDAFSTIGFSASRIGEVSQSTMVSKLDNNGAIQYYGHGVSGCGSVYGIWLNDADSSGGPACNDETLLPSEIPGNTANLDLAVYVACYSAKGSPNLIGKTVDNGADCAMGFSGTVSNGDAKCWNDDFFDCLDDESSTMKACLETAENSCSVDVSYTGSCNYVLTR